MCNNHTHHQVCLMNRMRNPGDFAAALTPFYGGKAADYFGSLLTEHLQIAGDLVNAAKKQESKQVDELRKKWQENANEIAAFLAHINPCWNEENWRSLLYDHLDMTEKEATLRLRGEFEQDIQMFEHIEAEALQMADCMSLGMIRQCCFC